MPAPILKSLLSISLLCCTSIFSQAQLPLQLNEVMANNSSITNLDATVTDWVEIYNPNSSPVDMGDMSLTDNPSIPRKWVFPTGVTVPANGYLVVKLDGDRPASTTASDNMNAGFSISSTGDPLYLFGKGVGGAQVDFVLFGLQAADYTIGRIQGVWKLNTPTRGQANVEAQLGAVTALKINEWVPRPTSGDDWFEIFNTGNLPVNLSGLFLTDTSADKIKSPIPPLSFLGVGGNGFIRMWADSNADAGADHVNFGLSSNGEAIGIFGAGGVQIDYVTFPEQTVTGNVYGRLPDGSNNLVLFGTNPTPGDPNFLRYPNLWVNELLSHTDPPLEDAVEFYNPTDAVVDVSGWWLSDSKNNLKRYQLPPNTFVQPRSFLVIYERDFGYAPSAASPFNFSSSRGDEVYLSQIDASSGNLTGYRVFEAFEPAQNGVSFGRVQTSVPGDYKFVALSRPTFGVDNPTSLEQFRTGTGAPNAAPRVGPIVVNEIMYNAVQSGTLENTLDEYIELYNLTGATVQLYDPAFPANRWSLRDGLSFQFPTGSAIPAFGYALAVSFDPIANTAQRDAFRAKYNVPTQVQLFGPWIGQLENSGDSIEFYKPDQPQLPPDPDAGFVPYYRIDKVNFDDAAPWPAAADGTGNSLHKKSPALFGNDPVNWQAAAPNPGRANSNELLDTDGDGMPDTYEDANGFDKNSGLDARLDFDSDGHSNLQEYVAGTNPKDAASKLQVVQITHPPGPTSTSTLQISVVPGKSYTLQARNDLSPTSQWITVQNFDATTATATVPDPQSAGLPYRFYRVVTPAIN